MSIDTKAKVFRRQSHHENEDILDSLQTPMSIALWRPWNASGWMYTRGWSTSTIPCKYSSTPRSEKLTDIFKTPFSTSLSLVKNWVPWSRFHWNMFPRVQLILNWFLLRLWLGGIMKHAITLINMNPHIWHNRNFNNKKTCAWVLGHWSSWCILEHMRPLDLFTRVKMSVKEPIESVFYSHPIL